MVFLILCFKASLQKSEDGTAAARAASGIADLPSMELEEGSRSAAKRDVSLRSPLFERPTNPVLREGNIPGFYGKGILCVQNPAFDRAGLELRPRSASGRLNIASQYGQISYKTLHRANAIDDVESLYASSYAIGTPQENVIEEPRDYEVANNRAYQTCEAADARMTIGESLDGCPGVDNPDAETEEGESCIAGKFPTFSENFKWNVIR